MRKSNLVWAFVALFLALFILPQMSSALVVPTGVANVINMTLASSVGANVPFQVPFPASTYTSYLASNVMNLASLFYTSNGVTCPTWIEANALNPAQKTNLNTVGNLIIWARCPAGVSNAANVVAMGLGQTSTDFFITGNNIGESPLLSTTYGTLDNGNTVFTSPYFYYNFMGTSTPSGITTTGTITISNGVTTSVAAAGSALTTSSFSANSAVTYDELANVIGNAGGSNNGCLGFATSSCSGAVANFASWLYDGDGPASTFPGYGGGGVFTSLIGTTNQLELLSIRIPDTGHKAFSVNYKAENTITSGFAGSQTFGVGNQGSNNNFATVYYMRSRPTTSPAITFGPVQPVIGSGVTITITPNPVTYPATSNANGICTPITDSCAIDFPTLGTHVATGTGSANYIIPIKAAGTYTYYVNDITTNSNALATLTVNTNTPILNFITTCPSQTYNGLGCTTTANVLTYNNQEQLDLWLNNVLVANTVRIPPGLAYVSNYDTGVYNVVIINTATNTVVGAITQGFNQPFQINFVNTFPYGYVTNFGSSNVVLLNPATNSIIAAINGGFDGPVGVGFHPSGKFAYVSNFNVGNVVIVDTATNSVVDAVSGSFSSPYDLHFDDGDKAYVANYGNNKVSIVNVATNSVVGTISGFNQPLGVSFAPSDTYAYVTNYGNGTISIVNGDTNTIVGTITGFNQPRAVEFSPDGTFAYVNNGGADNVKIVSTATNTIVGTISSGFSLNTGVDFDSIPAAYNSNSVNYTTTGSASTYTYVANTVANTNYTANSITYAYTVSKATPILAFPVTCSSGDYIGVACSTVANILTYQNQDQLSLYLNGALVGQTTTGALNSNSIIYTTNGIGTFNFVANALSITNYTAASISYSYTQASSIFLKNSTANPAMTFPSLAHLPTCANTLGSTCIGNDIISGNVRLNNNLFVFGNITVVSGATLDSNTFSIFTTGTFTNLGAIMTGNSVAGGAGGNPNGFPGVSLPLSFGGSGGGGQGNAGGACPSCVGGHGGNTLANGGGDSINGGTPAAPTVNNANILTWFKGGMINYLSGAGGGGAGDNGGTGGAGAAGLYIQADRIVAGTINAIGIDGHSTSAAGGGGGTLLFAYGPGGYVAGTYNTLGGKGIAGGGGGGAGNGGVGQAASFAYGANVPIPILVYQVYPINLYSSSSNNGIKFYLYQDYNGIKTALQSNVPNINYTPSPGQPSGIYLFNVTETFSGTNTVIPINLSVNMTDIMSALTYNLPLVQYSTDFAYCPTFSARPLYWSIKSDLPLNQKNNQSSPCGEEFSNANITFTPELGLTYNGFSTFVANIVNNPLISAITQRESGFRLRSTNTILTTQRRISNFSVFSQETFAGLNGNNLTILVNASYNGYPIFRVLSNTSSDVYTFVMNRSNYTNSNIIYTMNASITQPLFFAQSDTYCPASVSYGSAVSYPIGLVDTNGTKYTFYVYNSGGSTAAGYLIKVLERHGVNATQVQSYQIPNVLPFSLPLEATGQEYAFIVENHTCTKSFFQGDFSIPVNPTYITLNSLITGYVYNKSDVYGQCRIASRASNTLHISCSGTDPQSLTQSYKLNVYTITSIVGTTNALFSMNFTGNSFIYNFTEPDNKTYSYSLYAYTTPNFSLAQLLNSGPLNSMPVPLSAPLLGFVAFLLMITLVLGGAATGKITMLIFFTDLGMFLVDVLHLVTIPITVGIVFVAIGLIAVWWDRRKKKVG